MSCKLRVNEYGEREKHCPRCPAVCPSDDERDNWWPADREFFHRNPSYPDGFDTYCRACRSEVRANDYLRRKERVNG